ncbi:MAG: hypothetical protein KF861_07590 [Planctomycetaceae bacterium]|nr:hypothetical protein [Planctomycetaceae bacterium]
MAPSSQSPGSARPARIAEQQARFLSVADESAIPQRPEWLPPRENGAAVSDQVPSLPTSPVLTHAPSERGTATSQPKADPASLRRRALAWLGSAAATGYGLSFLLHSVLMIGMALWIFPQVMESTRITTVVQSDADTPQPFDRMDDIHLEVPAGSKSIAVQQLTDVVQQEAEINVLEHQFLRDVASADSQGEGGSGAAGNGGFRLLEPRNAVKVGSFTAWTIPIARHPGEQPQSGDSPRPGQDYHIVIQVKIPGNRHAYNISDLSGKVIGTDGYLLIIPAQAFVQEENGRLVPARIGRRLEVVDGVVQILIRVPGAEALVKDTIKVKSKLLKEDQTLELIFGQRPGAEDDRR